MDKYLRAWRQDALARGQHDAAIYIGDKVFALTNNDSDAFWLAQVHFGNNNFTRALALLLRRDLIARSQSCRYLAAHCYIKQGNHDKALSILGPDDPTHLTSTSTNARRKLAHANGTASRHGTTRGPRHQRDRVEVSEERERDREQEKELKFQAGMCYLRGLCYAKRNAFDRAKSCYKNAVLIDVQCFEAFEQLMANSLMTPAEELEFLHQLDFDSIRIDDQSVAQEAADFTKLLYTTRLSKYASPQILAHATETLSTHYNLATNPDLLLTRAETLYTQCRFHEALAITTGILNSESDHVSLAENNTNAASLGHSPNLYALHLALLYETGSHNTLFHLSHTLSVHAPHEAYTYLAIGTYYLSTARIAEARRFFSKASIMDVHSAPAWIGFAHTFAAEGEHDQAIAAYSTALRLFQGSHLPHLFLGMQHLALNNMQLAWEYCINAFQMSSGGLQDGAASDIDLDNTSLDATRRLGGDPLVLNELGVILYHQGTSLPSAARLFRQALELAAELGCNMTAWVATRANLAHTLRRLDRLEESLAEFDECLRIATGGASPSSSLGHTRTISALGGLSIDAPMSTNGPSASGYEERNLIGSIHTSRGIVLLSMMGRTREAVLALHEAVRVLGGDAGGGGVAGTLLGRAMEIWALEGGQSEDDDSDDARRDKRMRGASNINIKSRRRGKEAESSRPQFQDSHGGILLDAPTQEKRLEHQLDGDADEILDAAYEAVR